MPVKLAISLLVLFSLSLKAQQSDIDVLLNSKGNQFDQRYEQRKISFMEGRRTIDYFNPVQLVMSGLMFAYQRCISPQLYASCIYHPSCSNFSKDLIKEFGLIKGMSLTADRITRCNRVSATDIPPIRFNDQLNLSTDDVIYFRNSSRR